MISRVSFVAEVVLYNIGYNLIAHNYNTVLVHQEIAEAFEYMLLVLVACQVIITHVKV